MITSIADLQSIISGYPDDEQRLIIAAAECSRKLHEGQLRESGEAYFTHPLQVAEILISQRLDGRAVAAALLHDALEDTRMTRQDLRREFGKEVESLVNGVTKIALVKTKNKSVQAAETLRKMLFAMVKDIRVILIKLADKLHNMRTLEFKREERRKEIATECLEVYAPLAGRLGISWLKDELEDLSLKHVNYASYQQIKQFVAKRRDERGEYLSRVESAILAAAHRAQVEVDVETRAKHFYSIYLKMRKRGKHVDEIYDLLGIRILCDSTNDCYAMLGVVHSLWPPIEGRFKDYIAMPKSNRYQSLHTTVLGYDGNRIEIQIRTREMHQTAEYGVAAHWVYKRDSTGRPHDELGIMSRVKDMGSRRITSNEFLEEIKRDLLKDSIYVFTPKGDAIQLPKGATAIDFAYHIHTEVGHHTMGAKADGSIIPLKEPLSNTQVIEILTSPSAHPHVNWLRAVKTGRARSKIRHWLNKHDDTIIIEKNVVARRKPEVPLRATPTRRRPRTGTRPTDGTTHLDAGRVAVRVGDERNMMIRFARCCEPKVGDDIVGYVSRGRGIIVHARSCKNVRNISEIDERIIEVEWETVSPKTTKRFHVLANRTNDLFSEIEGAVRKYHGHLIEGKITTEDSGRMNAFFTMEIDRTDDMTPVLKSIRNVPAVLSISDLDHSPTPVLDS